MVPQKRVVVCGEDGGASIVRQIERKNFQGVKINLVLRENKKQLKIKKIMELAKEFIGKKVLVRSYDAGVYFGTLEKVEGETVLMRTVRNIWRWNGATCLSQIANDGIKDGRVSQEVGSMILNRVCQILPLGEKAIKNLEEQPAWKI